MSHFLAVAEQRRALADELASLGPPQWATPSLCPAWTVQEVTAHLVAPLTLTAGGALRAVITGRGRIVASIDALTAVAARRPAAELVRDLRQRAGHRFRPPGLGSVAPLTDVLIHGEDIRVPLGLPPRVGAVWAPVLSFLVSRPARLAFVPHSLAGLAFRATDTDWSGGSGELVAGPAAALALAMTGRTARLGLLEGPGVARLAGRR